MGGRGSRGEQELRRGREVAWRSKEEDEVDESRRRSGGKREVKVERERKDSEIMYNIKGFGRIRMQARTRKGGWRQSVKYGSTEQAEIKKNNEDNAERED